MKEWCQLNLAENEKEVVIGSPDNAIVRQRTKNLIEAAEKSFKTSFLLRLLAGISCGMTVFPELPVRHKRKVLYLHGELSTAEIRERTLAVTQDFNSDSLENLWQGRLRLGHLIERSGQNEIVAAIRDHRPDDVALDPWQSFIGGHEENAFTDMSKPTDFCPRLIEGFGVTLWIPIHLGKDRAKGARGHSTIAGWRDTRIQLKKDRDKLKVTVDPRWGKPPEPFELRFAEGTLWPNEQSAYSQQTGKIVCYIKEQGGQTTKDAVVKHLGTNDEAGRKAIERAQKLE